MTMKYLTEKEEKALVKTVREIKGRRAERDRVIIELLLGTGLRAAELVGLNVGDLRGKEKLYVRPEIAKGGKGRFVPVSVDLQRLLKGFFRDKLAWGESIRDEAPLFVSRQSGRLSKIALQKRVQGWVIRAGLTTTLEGRTVALYGVHSCRHTFAKRLLERGVKLPTVQKLLGHASLASTGIYTEASWEEMVEAVEARG